MHVIAVSSGFYLLSMNVCRHKYLAQEPNACHLSRVQLSSHCSCAVQVNTGIPARVFYSAGDLYGFEAAS